MTHRRNPDYDEDSDEEDQDWKKYASGDAEAQDKPPRDCFVRFLIWSGRLLFRICTVIVRFVLDYSLQCNLLAMAVFIALFLISLLLASPAYLMTIDLRQMSITGGQLTELLGGVGAEADDTNAMTAAQLGLSDEYFVHFLGWKQRTNATQTVHWATPDWFSRFLSLTLPPELQTLSAGLQTPLSTSLVQSELQKIARLIVAGAWLLIVTVVILTFIFALSIWVAYRAHTSSEAHKADKALDTTTEVSKDKRSSLPWCKLLAVLFISGIATGVTVGTTIAVVLTQKRIDAFFTPVKESGINVTWGWLGTGLGVTGSIVTAFASYLAFMALLVMCFTRCWRSRHCGTFKEKAETSFDQLRGNSNRSQERRSSLASETETGDNRGHNEDEKNELTDEDHKSKTDKDSKED